MEVKVDVLIINMLLYADDITLLAEHVRDLTKKSDVIG